jgi:hypothetical protein
MTAIPRNTTRACPRPPTQQCYSHRNQHCTAKEKHQPPANAHDALPFLCRSLSRRQSDRGRDTAGSARHCTSRRERATPIECDRALRQSVAPPGRATVAIETTGRLLMTGTARQAANARSRDQQSGRPPEATVTASNRPLLSSPKLSSTAPPNTPSARRAHSGRAIVPTAREPAMPMATTRSRGRRQLRHRFATNPLVKFGRLFQRP